MNDNHGPFDRVFEGGLRDRNARYIMIGLGVIGLLLIVFVFSPLSLFGGDDNDSDGSSIVTNGDTRLPRVPEGFEAVSQVFSASAPKDTTGPYTVTLKLLQPTSDGRNLGVYTQRNGEWERIAAATLANNGTAVTAEVPTIPSSYAVLRRTTSAAQVSGWLPAGAPIDPAALDVLTVVNPIDYVPAADGALTGTPMNLPNTKGLVMPTVRASDQRDAEALNTILASPALRDAHVAALLAVAQQQGNAGVDLDYRAVNPARKADFTAFVTVLADRLHQANKSVSITLPMPTKAGVAWDTGAYDWEELSRRVDTIKMLGSADPSQYYQRMDEVLQFLQPKIDMRKVQLVLTRRSIEKGSDGLRALSLHEGLALASTIEVRTSAPVAPNASVIIVGKNIFQDDGASGLNWDDTAFSVAFTYPGRGGQRTVWLENSLSLAFKMDLAKRYGMGGVSLDNVSQDPSAPNVWGAFKVFAETGSPELVQPNSVLLRPTWQVQAGSSEPNAKGSVVWRAPAQPGSYDIALIVSDGVIRAAQKVVMDVRTAGTAVPSGTPGTPAAGTGTPAAPRTPTPTPRP